MWGFGPLASCSCRRWVSFESDIQRGFGCVEFAIFFLLSDVTLKEKEPARCHCLFLC